MFSPSTTFSVGNWRKTARGPGVLALDAGLLSECNAYRFGGRGTGGRFMKTPRRDESRAAPAGFDNRFLEKPAR